MSHPIRRRAVPAVIAALLSATAACSSGDSPAPPDRITTAYDLPERAYPESITVDPHTAEVYTSSFLTGAVYRATPGKPAAETFLPAGADGRRTANGVKADANGRLWVIDHTAGITVYDTKTRALLARFDVPAEGQPFVNDLAVTPDGGVYITDSVRNVVYRIGPDQLTDAFAHDGHGGALRVYLDLGAAKDPAAQQPMTLNGIAADDTGKYLIVVDMTNGDLYRVSTEPRPAVRRLTLTGGNAVDGDGLELRGDTLWVVHNKSNAVSRWHLSDDGAKAELQHRVTDPALDIPTSIAHSGDRALVTVSQFDKNGPYGDGTPAGFRIVEIAQL
ncbi:SMP-30/gluconolactonase/LRE family protein [Nocardia aurantiaca]|uniref:Superoxide dismutase n=1 Tax=Nocardia aurantiaca TaxID=2675850 RepID=A0A6I3KW76_9NOCA|nr:SMP-30/gluconolactonase/LRE family protein [Nocardia aurantiaca]MTE13118.1 superoxide dismutase [Nocardia aurantiaca]